MHCGICEMDILWGTCQSDPVTTYRGCKYYSQTVFTCSKKLCLQSYFMSHRYMKLKENHIKPPCVQDQYTLQSSTVMHNCYPQRTLAKRYCCGQHCLPDVLSVHPSVYLSPLNGITLQTQGLACSLACCLMAPSHHQPQYKVTLAGTHVWLGCHWWHQAITWTNVDLPLMKSCSIQGSVRYVPSQWETSLHYNDVSRWLGSCRVYTLNIHLRL